MSGTILPTFFEVNVDRVCAAMPMSSFSAITFASLLGLGSGFLLTRMAIDFLPLALALTSV